MYIHIYIYICVCVCVCVCVFVCVGNNKRTCGANAKSVMVTVCSLKVMKPNPKTQCFY